MISFVKGIIEEIETDRVIIENQGIGYQIYMPQSDLEIMKSGEDVKIYTYLSVKEDAMQLFGFLTKEALTIYKLLLGVSGVGPKGGLAIISTCPGDSLHMAIVSGDAKAISKAPGIGNKTAQKIIIELKDKINLEEIIVNSTAEKDVAGPASQVQKDAIEALVSLGYSQSSAFQAVKKVHIADDADVEDVLKLALKNIF